MCICFVWMEAVIPSEVHRLCGLFMTDDLLPCPCKCGGIAGWVAWYNLKRQYIGFGDWTCNMDLFSFLGVCLQVEGVYLSIADKWNSSSAVLCCNPEHGNVPTSTKAPRRKAGNNLQKWEPLVSEWEHPCVLIPQDCPFNVYICDVLNIMFTIENNLKPIKWSDSSISCWICYQIHLSEHFE